jgi:hypothetical protein
VKILIHQKLVAFPWTLKFQISGAMMITGTFPS